MSIADIMDNAWDEYRVRLSFRVRNSFTISPPVYCSMGLIVSFGVNFMVWFRFGSRM